MGRAIWRPRYTHEVVVDNILILSPNNTWLPSYPHKSTFELLYYRSFGKMLIFCWQLVHVARNAGISKDVIFFVILDYYLINYVKFSAIYVLTTSPLVSDNRVLSCEKSTASSGRVAGA